MQISVTGRHVKITEAIRSYASDKLGHAFEKYDRIENVHIILDIQKYHQIAEVVIQAKNHIRVEAKEDSDDMYVSIDTAIVRAEKQLHKLRDKIQNHKSMESLGHIERNIQDDMV